MKLSKMQLKRIIRKTLNESVWMMNDGMGGPEDQAFPEGTSIDDAARQMVIDMDNDFPGSASEAASILRSPFDLQDNLYGLGLSDETAEAIDEALEALDVEGSGNYDYDACCEALFNAINARSGSHFIEESRRRNLHELDFSGPAVGTDADVYGERIKPPQNKSQAEDLLHDALLAVEQYLSLEEIEAIFAQLY